MAALFIVGLLCAAALHLVNVVRSAQYQENMVSGSLYLLAEHLRHKESSLNAIANQLDATIRIEPIDSLNLSAYKKSRLERGLPLIKTLESGREALLKYALDDKRVMLIQLSNVHEQYVQMTAHLLLESWQNSGEPIDVYLAKIRPHFGYFLSVNQSDSLRLSLADFSRLQYGDVIVRMNIDNRTVEALVQVPNTESILRLGPLLEFNPYAWQVISVILLFAILALGVGVYWVVNSFEIRLRKLEQATTRLAQGHMNSRVLSDGQDPVGRLGAAFNKMAEHIQRLMLIQREMVRAVSHELRTPVARIRFGMQMIEDSVDDPFVAKQINGMDNDIQELEELIDEILTYARLEEGGPLLEFQQVNLAAIAEQVVNEARPPKHIKVTYQGVKALDEILTEIEPRYIHRAIQNLVGNAGRYAASEVRVTCMIDNDICRIDVEDDGPGIPEEHWERVFTAFARLDDSRTRASGGYGLGLSIVRRIVYWHGGRALVMHSEKMGGAHFMLVWPRRH